MNTRIAALILALLALALPGRSQELPALIVDIGILGGPRMVRPHPPSSLSLGVEMSRSAYYKLLRGKEVLDAGLMNSGFNSRRPVNTPMLWSSSRERLCTGRSSSLIFNSTRNPGTRPSNQTK